MPSACDDLERALDDVVEHHALFLDENFMKNVFSREIKMLPPFKEFFEHKWDAQEKLCVKEAERHINKIKCYSIIIKELFEPEIETNRNSTIFMQEASQKFIKAFLKELRDPKKTTYNHLSILHVELS